MPNDVKQQSLGFQSKCLHYTRTLPQVRVLTIEWDQKIAWITATRFLLNDFRSFNSPFEVLFNFPSGYLFAIDLLSVFSLGWRLPPYLHSTPKERDSCDPHRAALYSVRQGYHLLWRTFPSTLNANNT